MIRVYIDDDLDKPVVTFNGPNFQNIVGLLKKVLKFEYIPEKKVWTAHAHRVLNSLTDLRDIEDVEIDDYTMDALEDMAKGAPSIKKWRMPLDRSIMKFDPIKGKAPNEDFQLQDIKKLINTNRKGLFNQMGLGKTYEVITTLDQFYHRDMIDKVLIVAPSEGVGNWKREIKKFSSQIDPARIDIANVKNREPFHEDNDVVIMTYRTFLMISDDYYKKNTKGKGKAKKYRKPQIPFESWGAEGRRVLILDESHNAKNPKARQTHAISLHKNYFEYRYLLTGTPADKVEHYYSQIRLLDEELIPESYNEWISSLANVGDRFSDYNINYYYPDKVEKFVQRITPYIIRRRSEDHLELPENYIEKIYVEIEDLQREIYEALIYDTLQDVADERGFVDTKTVMNRFPFLTLALDNPDILKGSKVDYIGDHLNSLLKKWKFSKHGKLPATDSLLSKYFDEGRKVIVWSGHPATIDSLVEHYKKHDPLHIHGAMSFGGKTRDQYRDDMVEEFKHSEDRKLLIASYKVLNSAVTITQATRNIYFDRSYSLTEWLQSQKRTHRIGQDERVITNPIIFDETLDTRLDARLESKEDIDKLLLKRNELTMEQWQAIFGGDITI